MVRPGLSSWRSAVRARALPPRRPRQQPLPRLPPSRAPRSRGLSHRRSFHRGLKCRRSGGRPKRHETLREPMERRQGRRNDRRSKLAAVFIAVPIAPRLRRFVFGRFRSRLCPSARSCFASQSGSLFPWWQQSVSAPHRMPARPPPCRPANTQRSSRRAPVARRTPSCGSTHRRASIIIREPATTGTPSRAHICARLTRAGAAIVRRGTANVRLRLIRGQASPALICGSSRPFDVREPSQHKFLITTYRRVANAARPSSLCDAAHVTACSIHV